MSRIMDGLLTFEQMAKVLNVKTSTVRRWVKEGHIPSHTYIHVGITYRFDKKAVLEALKRNQKDAHDPDAYDSEPVQLELDLEDDTNE